MRLGTMAMQIVALIPAGMDAAEEALAILELIRFVRPGVLNPHG